MSGQDTRAGSLGVNGLNIVHGERLSSSVNKLGSRSRMVIFCI